MRYFPVLIKESGEVHPADMTLPLLFFSSLRKVRSRLKISNEIILALCRRAPTF